MSCCPSERTLFQTEKDRCAPQDVWGWPEAAVHEGTRVGDGLTYPPYATCYLEGKLPSCVEYLTAPRDATRPKHLCLVRIVGTHRGVYPHTSYRAKAASVSEGLPSRACWANCFRSSAGREYHRAWG